MRAPANPATPEPTAREIKTLKRLGERAGGAERLLRWIKIAYPSRPPGRPAGATRFADFDDDVLLVAGLVHLKTKLPMHTIIKKIATDQNPRGRLRWNSDRGARSEAMVKRLLAKHRADQIAFENMSEAEIELGLQKFFGWVETLDEDSPDFKIACLIATHLFCNRAE